MAEVHAEIVANHSVPVVRVEQGWLKGDGSLEAESRPGGDAPLWYSRFIAINMPLGA